MLQHRGCNGGEQQPLLQRQRLPAGRDNDTRRVRHRDTRGLRQGQGMVRHEHLGADTILLPALPLLPCSGTQARLLSHALQDAPTGSHPQTFQRLRRNPCQGGDDRGRIPELRQAGLPAHGKEDVRCRTARPQRALRGVRHVQTLRQAIPGRLWRLLGDDHGAGHRGCKRIHAPIPQGSEHLLHRRPHQAVALHLQRTARRAAQQPVPCKLQQ